MELGIGNAAGALSVNPEFEGHNSHSSTSNTAYIVAPVYYRVVRRCGTQWHFVKGESFYNPLPQGNCWGRAAGNGAALVDLHSQ